MRYLFPMKFKDYMSNKIIDVTTYHASALPTLIVRGRPFFFY